MELNGNEVTEGKKKYPPLHVVYRNRAKDALEALDNGDIPLCREILLRIQKHKFNCSEIKQALIDSNLDYEGVYRKYRPSVFVFVRYLKQHPFDENEGYDTLEVIETITDLWPKLGKEITQSQ